MTSAKPALAPLASVTEYFTLRRATEISARISEPARITITNTLALGRQKAEASETLWTNGHTAEGLRLAIEALETSATTTSAYARALALGAPDAPREPAPETDADVALQDGPSEPPPLDERAVRALALQERGATPGEIERIEGALGAARTVTLPALDAEIAPAHTHLYERVADARRILDRRFDAVAHDARQLRYMRAGRIATVIVAAVAVIVGLYLLTRRPDYTVSASAVWGNAADFQPEKVADGRNESWWLLPDGQTGWVEVRFSAPKHIARVAVTNTTNAPHMDRGTDGYQLELYGAGRILRTIEGSFEFTPRPEPVWHDVDLDGVERIRFVVRSHHRTGAGLSELAWE